MKKVKSNEWQMPVMDNYRMGCCDCGLVHDVDFQVVDAQDHGQVISGVRVLMRARRNDRSTAQLRRKKEQSTLKYKEETMITEDSSIGQILWWYRRIRKMRQWELAKKVGLSSTYISQIENNRSEPTQKTLNKISKALGIEVKVYYRVEDKKQGGK